MVDGHIAFIAGYVELPFELSGVKRDIRVAVIPDDQVDCYLGANFVREFGTVHDPIHNQLIVTVADEKRGDLEVAAVSSVEALEAVAVGLEDISEGQRREMEELVGRILGQTDDTLGCTTWVRHHNDVGSARLIKQRYYLVSKKLEEEMHRQVVEMLESGVIESSVSAWSSPVVMVRKGVDKYRFCIDFRKLNAASKADAYPLPYMDSILRKLRNTRYISTLDLSAAYHQILLTSESKELTAFIVPGLGLYQFTRMPYGLSQVAATFQRLIDKVIGPELEPYAFSYLDDIIIATESYEEHLKWLEYVLKRVKEAGLTPFRQDRAGH